MNKLITGSDGFLASHLQQHLKMIQYNHRLEEIDINSDLVNISEIWHFASPSEDIEFRDDLNTFKSIVIGTANIIALCKKNNIKLIFASSLAADLPEHQICNYGKYKKLAEKMIIYSGIDYCILKIPRVYGKDRKKGLMKKINQNLIHKDDMHNIVEYLDISDFINQTLNNTKCKIYYYENLKQNTITEIKKIYFEVKD